MADGAEQLDAAHLEILEIAAVMHVTHLVHFGVADSDGDGVVLGGHGGKCRRLGVVGQAPPYLKIS